MFFSPTSTLKYDMDAFHVKVKVAAVKVYLLAFLTFCTRAQSVPENIVTMFDCKKEKQKI